MYLELALAPKQEDLFVATRGATDQPFGDPIPLTKLSSNSTRETAASISDDGLAIFFTGNHPGTLGPADIWMATRPRRFDEAGNRVRFEPPVPVGHPVNTSMLDAQPFISSDWPRSGAKLYFVRKVARDVPADIYEATWHLDCNGNAQDDLEEIEEGLAQDCKGNGIPDSCDISSGEALDENANGVPDECDVFHRSDADDNGSLELTDAVFVLNWLFLGGPTPSCLDAADADNDGENVLTDAVYVLSFLFLGGPAPSQPAPPGLGECGPDQDPEGMQDGLGCEFYTNC